jgi:hypothetical protein
MNKNDPKTPAEWQEAVNAAYVMRCIADCVMVRAYRDGYEDRSRRDAITFLPRVISKGIGPEPGIIEKTFPTARPQTFTKGRAKS